MFFTAIDDNCLGLGYRSYVIHRVALPVVAFLLLNGCGVIGALQPPPPTPQRMLNGPNEFSVGIGAGTLLPNPYPGGGVQVQYVRHSGDEAKAQKQRGLGARVESTGYQALLLNFSIHTLVGSISIYDDSSDEEDASGGSEVRLGSSLSLGGRFGSIMNHGTLFVGFDIEVGATIAYDNPEFPLVFGRLGVPVGIQLNDELTFYVTPSALLGISDGLLPGTKIPIGLVWAIDDGIAMNFEIDPTWLSPGYPSLSFNVGVRFR